MIEFAPCRHGGPAMDERAEFASWDDLKAFLRQDWTKFGAECGHVITLSDIRAEAYHYDDRTKWDAWILTGALSNGEHPVLGFTNGDPRNSATIISLADHTPMSPLFDIRVYRHPNGSLGAGPIDAFDAWFEETPGMTNVERMQATAALMPEVQRVMEECALSIRRDGQETPKPAAPE